MEWNLTPDFDLNFTIDYATFCIVQTPDHYSKWPVCHMRCPKCGRQEDKVIDSRASREGATIRRRRQCEACGFRFTTYEVIERGELVVVKRDGRREEFSREKLLSGVRKACQKRPNSPKTSEDLVERNVN